MIVCDHYLGGKAPRARAWASPYKSQIYARPSHRGARLVRIVTTTQSSSSLYGLVTEIGVVEDVEEIPPRLKRNAPCESEQPWQRQIELSGAESPPCIVSQVSLPRSAYAEGCHVDDSPPGAPDSSR